MSSRNNYVIVIGRQFGCGGRRIGKKLAERLGVDYFDKALLNEASKKNGLSPHIFEAADEKRPRLLNSILQSFFGVMDNYTGSPVSKEGLYKIQSDAIKSIADEKSCVIVGRTADYVLRDHPNMISVFLHAPAQHRAEGIVKRGDAQTVDEAVALAKKIDNNRENYYNFFTGRNWGHSTNYHITIDSSRISDDQIVNLIENMIRNEVKS